MISIVTITDCRDENAKMRLVMRAATEVSGVKPVASSAFVAVNSGIELAFNTIDAIDAMGGQEGLILGNVAPRQGQLVNGCEFGFAWVEKTLIVSTINGFDLLPRFIPGAAHSWRVRVPDRNEFICLQWQGYGQQKDARFDDENFRSLVFLPGLASIILQEHRIKTEPYFPTPQESFAVCWVDECGTHHPCNLKTTILWSDLRRGGRWFEIGEKVRLNMAGRELDLRLYPSLRSVPDGELGLVVGSSGLGNERFLEIMKKGGSAAQELNLMVGDPITIL